MNKQWSIVRKYLSLAAAALSFVSFYTTAQGLHEFVFHKMWQAALISAAIQISLFVLNLKLFYFLKKKRWVALSLWLLTISASSTFSFVYIANEIYDDSLYYSDVNRIMDEKVTVMSFNFKDYIESSMKYVKETMNAYCSTLSIHDDSQNPGSAGKQLIVNCINSLKSFRLYREGNAVFSQSVQLLSDADNTLPENYSEEEIDSAIASAESVKSNLGALQTSEAVKKSTLEGMWNSNNERLKQYNDFKDSEFKKLQQQNDDLKKEIDKLEDNLVEITAAYGSASLCTQKLTTEKNNNMSNKMEASKQQLLLEVNKETLDTKIIEASMNDIYGLLIKQGYTGDSYQIKNYFSFKQAVSAFENLNQLYEDNQKVLDQLDSARITGSEEDNSILAGDSAASLSLWKAGWHGQMNQLRSIVRDCPLPTDMLIMAKDENGNFISLNSENTLIPMDRVAIINSVSSMERSYLENLNRMEKAGNLLFSKYRGMAIFSLAAAVFLDMLGTIIGAFLYFNKPEKRKDGKAPQPAQNPGTERPDWSMEDQPVYL